MMICGNFTLGRLFDLISAHFWFNGALYFSLKNLFCGKNTLNTNTLYDPLTKWTKKSNTCLVYLLSLDNKTVAPFVDSFFKAFLKVASFSPSSSLIVGISVSSILKKVALIKKNQDWSANLLFLKHKISTI